MPISCPIKFLPLSTEEFRELDYALMAHAFASHKTLGKLADEVIYQGDFAARIHAAGWEVQREVPVTVSFRSFVKVYALDLVIAGKAIYEFKTDATLTPEHEAQLMNYLMVLDCRRGKLVNFRPASVETWFVNTPITSVERRSFEIADSRWQGAAEVRDWIIEMLRDWGTGLELALYQQAIVYLLGGEQSVSRQLPMRRDGIELGNQRFLLMDESSAFRVTALENPTQEHEQHLYTATSGFLICIFVIVVIVQSAAPVIARRHLLGVADDDDLFGASDCTESVFRPDL